MFRHTHAPDDLDFPVDPEAVAPGGATTITRRPAGTGDDLDVLDRVLAAHPAGPTAHAGERRRLLMIAYHYPPVHGSSGIQRTLRFARYLPAHGWDPIVLTINPRAYPAHSAAEADSPAPVCRAFGLDASRHLSIRGRYPRALALPDRWSSWLLGAVPEGLRMIARHRPAAIWSTYPIATAHLIGLALHRLSGLPWLADFRDPMIDSDYPHDGRVRRMHAWIEDQALRRSALATFTAPGAMAACRGRHPDLARHRAALLENGFDEEAFQAAEAWPPEPRKDGRITLLHSGTLYPSERDPTAFFAALADLRLAGRISRERLCVRLRATGHDAHLLGLIERFRLQGLVELAPSVPTTEALREMSAADGLLILQASDCNRQIPAKAYEYLRARRPILALTDPTGDTADVLRRAGMYHVAPLDSKAAIMVELARFMSAMQSAVVPTVNERMIAASSRAARTRQLAGMLDEVCRQRA